MKKNDFFQKIIPQIELGCKRLRAERNGIVSTWNWNRHEDPFSTTKLFKTFSKNLVSSNWDC